jgi:hypothetical protein
LDQVNLFFPADFIKEPKTFELTFDGERKEDQIKRKDAFNKELKEMAKRGIREFIDEK